MNVRIVLVEPHEAGNVGAAARAMKNFGFTDLTIVGERPLRTDPISEWWACGAEDLIENARRFGKLEEAIADCALSVATTAVRGNREVFEQLTPASVARLAESSLNEQHTLAIVFGREEFGLRNTEIALCQRTASIPTAPGFPTMNLAQSVAVFCYELSKGLRPAQEEKSPAPGYLQQLLDEQARAMLDEVGYLRDPNPGRIFDELRAVANRAMLTTREASLMLALVKQIRWKLGLPLEDVEPKLRNRPRRGRKPPG